MPTVRAMQGDTIDAVVYRYFGRTRGLVESVLALNPGIADGGPILALGQEVTLPEAPQDQPTTPIINLWD